VTITALATSIVSIAAPAGCGGAGGGVTGAAAGDAGWAGVTGRELRASSEFFDISRAVAPPTASTPITARIIHTFLAGEGLDRTCFFLLFLDISGVS